MRDLSPFKGLIHSIFTDVGVEKYQQFSIHGNVLEDNAGAPALAKLELPWMTPLSKHFTIKYHWF